MKKYCATCGLEKDREDFPSTGFIKLKDGSKTKLIKPDCKPCHNKKVSEHFFEMLNEIGLEFKCRRCGYDKCRSALDLHHTDPNEKDFTIGSRRSVNIETLKTEINKCIVLCKICHCELHVGVWQLEDIGLFV